MYHTLTRWLIAEVLASPVLATAHSGSAPAQSGVKLMTQSNSYSTRPTRTNAEGVAIIKKFEGFPVGIEPDLQESEQVVHNLVTVPLNANQFSALVSFTYNLGEATLKQSVLLRHLNAGRYRAAANEFDRWVYIGTGRFAKLVERRIAEKGLFLKVMGSESAIREF